MNDEKYNESVKQSVFTLVYLAPVMAGLVVGSFVFCRSIEEGQRREQRKISEKNKRIYYEHIKQPIEATVVEEHYDSCPHSPTYALTLKTNDGKTIGLSITGTNENISSLERIIKPNNKISFPETNIVPTTYTECYRGETLLEEIRYAPSREETDFTPNTQHGTKHADRIKVISN